MGCKKDAEDRPRIARHCQSQTRYEQNCHARNETPLHPQVIDHAAHEKAVDSHEHAEDPIRPASLLVGEAELVAEEEDERVREHEVRVALEVLEEEDQPELTGARAQGLKSLAESLLRRRGQLSR